MSGERLGTIEPPIEENPPEEKETNERTGQMDIKGGKEPLGVGNGCAVIEGSIIHSDSTLRSNSESSSMFTKFLVTEEELQKYSLGNNNYRVENIKSLSAPIQGCNWATVSAERAFLSQGDEIKN